VIGISGRFWTTLWLAGALATGPSFVRAADQAMAETDGSAPGASQVATGAPSALAQKSDEELTEIARRWADLGPDERNALVTEVKARMARRGSPGVLRIRLERRYGTVVRARNGTVLRIERVQRVITQPGQPAQVLAGSGAAQEEAAPGDPAPTTVTTPRPSSGLPAGFGIGFERRAAASGKGEPPAVLVRDDRDDSSRE
jgi:hypothetical protein